MCQFISLILDRLSALYKLMSHEYLNITSFVINPSTPTEGGPKDVVATLSTDKQSITFPDGNTWKKNANLYDGIYKDPNYPNGYRIIRKFKSTKTVTEVNNTGNPKDSKFIKGEHGSLFSIPTTAFKFYDYTGKQTCGEKKCRSCEVPVCTDEVAAQFSLQESNTVFPYGTITFPDKTIWTRI